MGDGRGGRPPAETLTCRLLLARWAPHLLTRRSHLEKQSKKLQSWSPVQFCSRISLILGSKKAMSTSMATTCNQAARVSEGGGLRAQGGRRALPPCPRAGVLGVQAHGLCSPAIGETQLYSR